MDLSSLPRRPFELAELRELNESGRFRAVFPAAVFDLEGTDKKLVPVAVLVTPGDDGRVVGVGYDFDDGWTRVTSEPAGDDVQSQVESGGNRLQSWARETEQRWTASDGATALVEHVREQSNGGDE
jgi:hypothetical protein